MYVFVLFGLIGAVLGGSSSDMDQPATAETPEPTTVTAANEATTGVTDTPIPTTATTAEPTQTPTTTAEPTQATTTTATSTQQQVTVVEVVDGDTVKFSYQNGTRETARLLGVDTPETYGDVHPEEFEGVPDSSAGRQCLSESGDAATVFTRERLLGETVTLQFDDNEPRRGYYGRLLVYIYVDGELFNDDLVRDGHARVYSESSFTKKSQFLELESEAQSAERGVWDCRNAQTPTPTPTPDSDSGSSGGTLDVASVHEDASGNDHDNLNDEYIVFKNTGSGSLDLSGWTVEDEADHVYYFPSGFTLEAGESVTLYTGSGSDSSSELYWGEGAAVWNNGGDTIIVTDDSGSVVIRHEYSG